MAVILVQYSELPMILGNDQEDPFDCHSLCSRLFLRATGAVQTAKKQKVQTEVSYPVQNSNHNTLKVKKRLFPVSNQNLALSISRTLCGF